MRGKYYFLNKYFKIHKIQKQAVAELCQAQEKLGLAKPALPSKKLWLQ